MEDKEKVDVGDEELYEKCAAETDTAFVQQFVEWRPKVKYMNDDGEWVTPDLSPEELKREAEEKLDSIKKDNPKRYERVVKWYSYYEQLDAQKKKENEQEAVQAAQDEEIVTAIYPFFKVKDNNEDTKMELARRLVGKIRKVWKLDIPEKGNCKGGSKCTRTLNLLIEQDKNKVINLQTHGTTLRERLRQYGLYTAERQNWDKQIREAERKG